MADEIATTYDAIIIPGGGLEPRSCLPQPWVRARLDEALRRKATTKYFIVLSRGTTHKPPPTDLKSFPIDEAAASAKYLLDNGVKDASRILMDSWSLDTIGNAFFARQMICEPLLLQKLLVVTSQFHMPRTRAVFEWVFSLNKGTATLDYCVSEDIGMSDEQKSARISKEQESLKGLKVNTIPQLETMAKLSRFLFQQHGAYNAKSVRTIRAGDLPNNEEQNEPSDSAVASTY